MKRFLTHSLIFLSPIVVTIILCIPSFWYEWHTFLFSMRVPSKTVAVIGDSHMQYSVNDEHIPYAENYAHRASSPNFWKAISRMAYQINPEIRYVIIGVNPNIVFKEDVQVSRLSFSRGHTPAMLMMDVMRHGDMGEFQMERILRRCWGGCILPAIKRIFKIDTNITLHEGWFCVDHGVDKELVWPKKREGMKVPDGYNSRGLREIESLINLAKKYGVRPILMTAPIPRQYLDAYTSEQVDFISRAIGNMSQKHGCKWLDYRNLFESNDYFCDEFHLNKNGANEFSKVLDKDLRELYPDISVIKTR